jgi:glucose-6-phosphate isomerase
VKDLSKIAGINIKLEDVGLVFDQENFPVEPKTRTYAEVKDVYLDKDAEDQDLYFMYRYFEGVDTEGIFDQNQVEYDLTVLNPGKIGEEYIKTAGHFHGYVPGTEISYPEVYEVIEGQIQYLLQTRPDAEGNVDVVIVTAAPGEKVVVPPNYGHVSVNFGPTVAVSANLQYRDLPASADYEAFKAYSGGAMFLTASGWQKNDQYKVKSVRQVRPKEKPEWGLTKSKPLYASFLEDPKKFDFLVHPQRYDFSDVWDDLK